VLLLNEGFFLYPNTMRNAKEHDKKYYLPWAIRFRERYEDLRLRKGKKYITQKKIADALGMTRGAVGHYMNGEREPSLEAWKTIAQLLETTPEKLQYGSKETEENIDKYIDSNQQDNVKFSDFDKNRLKLFNLYKIPLLDWVQAREGMNAVNMFAKDCKSFVYYDEKVSPNSFALTVEGTAMIPNTAGVRGYYPNERVIIDPELDPQHGDCVIADATHLSTPILRQYSKEAGIESLIAFDSRVKTIEITSEWKVLGVVVGYMGGRVF